jgi:hypothetical protein
MVANPCVCSGVIPSLVLAGGNAYYLWNEHWDHWNHMPPLEERTEYAYQNIRTKNYPWGNGDQVSFPDIPWPVFLACVLTEKLDSVVSFA